MQNLPKDITATKAAKICAIIDHLVDALGSEPGCSLRRAVILTDIDQYPGTTQAEVLDRLGGHKSTLTRDIEWLYDYGCVMRTADTVDKRSIQLRTCGYSKKNLDFALEYFDFDHISLKNFIIRFIKEFDGHKPTLRDAKIVSTVSDKRKVNRQDIYESLYYGPSTTDGRAISNLAKLGIITKQRDEEENDIYTG